uniref:T9SS type A sorting domain-containing protein n=1 Tax=Flavobacterium sp. TaxID=239 RepID=UPI004048FBBB
MKLKLLFCMLITAFGMQAKDGFSSKPDSFTFPNIGIFSTITGWGSNPDIPMVTSDGINYSASNVTFPSNGLMKFRQDQSWDVQWCNNQFPFGTAVLGNPDNISVPAGSYDVSFNFQTDAYSLTLLPSQCGGQFSDSGGSTENYAPNTNSIITICPENPTDIVTVTFTSFRVENRWDALYVFQGNSTASPQISSGLGLGLGPNAALSGGFWSSVPNALIPGPFESTSPGECLTFQFISDDTIQFEGWVANVTCAPLPTCPLPTALTVINVTEDTATISWTENAGATTWEYLLLPCGSQEPDATTTGFVSTTTNPINLTGLTSTTCYTLYVRTVCGFGDSSLWSVGSNFTTKQIPASINYFEDFEGIHGWTLSNGAQTNKWVVGTAVSNSSITSLYVSNNNGVSNTYTYTATSVVHAYRDIQLPPIGGEIIISFDWRNLGESVFDYIKVWLVPSTFLPSPGTQITETNSGGQQIGSSLFNNANFTTASFTVDITPFQGEVRRLVFEWRNDMIFGTNPPGAIDNILIESNFPNIGIVGTITNWGSNPDIPMTTEDGINYSASNVMFMSNEEMKFRQDQNWAVNWGATQFPSGTAVLGNPDNISVPAGSYDISFNFQTGAYSFTLLPSEFPVIGLIGEFNGWSESVNMFTTDGIVYTLSDYYFPAPGNDSGLKFRQDNSWEINWGGANFPSGTAVLGASSNIPVQQGFYDVSFNLSTLEYSFEPVLMAIIGTADVDFDTDTAMETTDGMIHTLMNKTLSNGILKFRTVGNWNVNFGASTFPSGVGVTNGDDIPVVAGVYNITLNRLTGAYNFEEVILPTTQLLPEFCGITLTSINANLYAEIIDGATAYKFKVVNGGEMQEIERPDSRFSMAFASGIMLSTTYDVSVSVYINNTWSPHGSVCTVTTPTVFPTSSLRSQFCNTTLSTLNDNIYANVVVGAFGYKFKLENNGNEQEIERPDSRFSMAFASGITAATTYNVSVSLNFNGVWQPYGSVCTITTPAALPTTKLRSSFCNGTVSSLGSNFYASVRVGAEAYKFKTMINGEEVEVERPDSRCFMSAFPGAMMNQTYSIQVAVQFGGVWSEYGNACNLNTGFVGEAPKLQLLDGSQAFDIKAYPNPFVSQIILSLSNENTQSDIMVYDMTGKLIQQVSTEQTSLEIGNNWSKGIYLVQIVQSQETKNIRIVKQ